MNATYSVPKILLDRFSDEQASLRLCTPTHSPTLIAAVMFGGADPKIAGLVPSDIEIRGNDFVKPLSWKASDKWAVKNLFEIKNARRVLLDGNRFHNSWFDSQHGYAIMLTPRNQNGKAPWSALEDLTFTRNLVTNCSSGIMSVCARVSGEFYV